MILDSKAVLADLETDLKAAHINLQIANMTGRSDLLTQQTDNMPLLLKAKQDFLDRALDGEAELFDKRIEVEDYESKTALTTSKTINQDDFLSQQIYMSRKSVAFNIKERDMAKLAANAEITSQLVHLLA